VLPDNDLRLVQQHKRAETWPVDGGNNCGRETLMVESKVDMETKRIMCLVVLMEHSISFHHMYGVGVAMLFHLSSGHHHCHCQHSAPHQIILVLNACDCLFYLGIQPLTTSRPLIAF